MSLRDWLFWNNKAKEMGLVPVTPERCQEIIDELRGTCKSLHDVCNDDELNNKFVCEAIDMELFECSQCGWWCELNEAVENDDGGEDVCTDCGE